MNLPKSYMDIAHVCDVCGKHRSIGGHEVCSKVRQARSSPRKSSAARKVDIKRLENHITKAISRSTK